MMAKPSKRESKLIEKVKPWIDYSDEGPELVLKKEAPQDVKIAFELLKKL